MKKNKILIYLVLVLSIVLIGAGSFLTYKKFFSTSITQKEENTPLLYEVTKQGSNNKMYLLGSIHIGNIDKIKLPKYLLDAYNSCDYVAFELLDIPQQDEKKFALKEGDSIHKHLSKETVEKIKNIFNEGGLPFKENLSPAYYNLILEQLPMMQPEFINTVGVDGFFMNKAKKDNKKLVAVEEFSTQEEIIYGQSDKLYEILINDKIDNIGKSIVKIKELYNSWKKGTIKETYKKLMEEEKSSMINLSPEDRRIVDEYNRKVLMDRDINMTLKFISHFEQNHKMLYIVGAAHVVGDNGIVEQLKAQGYTVKVVK